MTEVRVWVCPKSLQVRLARDPVDRCPCGAEWVAHPAPLASAVDAAELALGRAAWRLYTVGSEIAEPEDPERSAERYDAVLIAYDKAKAAVRAAREGGDDGSD